MRAPATQPLQPSLLPELASLRSDDQAPTLPFATLAAAAAPRVRAAAAGGRAPRDGRLSVCVQARRSSRDEYDDVAFDEEEDWETQVGLSALL